MIDRLLHSSGGTDSMSAAREWFRPLRCAATLLDVQNQLAQSRLALAESTVSLFKALGGGWQE